MRVLIADTFPAGAIEEMNQAGLQVIYNSKLDGDSLKKALSEHNPHVLVVRFTLVDAATIDCGKSLQMILRTTEELETVDAAYAAKIGIFVANCPGKHANAVSELTIGLMISIDRRMAEGNELLHQGKWNKGLFKDCKGLKGRTIGIIGFGHVGKQVCKAANAMEMNVLVYTKSQEE